MYSLKIAVNTSGLNLTWLWLTFSRRIWRCRTFVLKYAFFFFFFYKQQSALWYFFCNTVSSVAKEKGNNNHYENMPIQIYWKFYHQKNGIFQVKKSDIFHISARNINYGYSLEPPRRGGSNEYPQSMFLSRNKKNNVYPCKPQFYYIKVGQYYIGTFSWCALK